MLREQSASTGRAPSPAATYTTFGNIVKSQYPDLVPNYPAWDKISDTTLVKELSDAAAPKGQASSERRGVQQKKPKSYK